MYAFPGTPVVVETSAPARRPLFVVFEGGEGSGKSTQAKALHGHLLKVGLSSLVTRDPCGTDYGKKVERQVKRAKQLPPNAELFMFAAARAMLTEEVIRPALKSGTIVVSDRYAPSSMAYQGYGRGISPGSVAGVNRVATGGIRPDLVVLLDINPGKGLARKRGMAWDRFHHEAVSFHERVRKGYLEMARAEPHCWTIIDATLPKRTIAALVWARVAGMLSGHFPV